MRSRLTPLARFQDNEGMNTTLRPVRGKFMLAAGALTSGAFLFKAAPKPGFLLLAIMTLWVILPFVCLYVAETILARRGAKPIFFWGAVVLAIVSFAAYGYDALYPRKSQPAFFFVMVPLLEDILVAAPIVGIAIVSRNQKKGNV
jgi:hypothetical protein